MRPPAADLVVTNGVVLTMNAENRIIRSGAVAVAGDRITEIGPARSLASKPAAQTIDARGGIIMPGLVNVHTHAAMTLFRGLADDLPLMTWLNEHIFPAEARLDANRVYKGALLGCVEMIRSGTTCFCDMYLFEGAVAQAAARAGLRAVVGEVLFDFPSPNYGTISQGWGYVDELCEQWRHHPLITIAIEPHSPYLCEPRLLQRAFTVSQRQSAPLIMHVAETRNEVDTIQARYGRTPVGHLADLGVLAAHLVACHCVALTGEDIELLQRFDVKVAHNPESNMKLASGVAPIPRLLEAGVCVGLGTDGCASNNNLDLFQEMDTAAKLHKVHQLDPTVMDAATVLRMATIDAARALGLADQIGSLEPGKKADLIIIDTQQPHLTPMYHPSSHLVYAVRGSDVRTSVVNGRVLMADRQLTGLDVKKIMADVRVLARSIGNR